MQRLPMLASVCVVALAAWGCKKTGGAGPEEPQQAGLLREVEAQAAEDLECQGGGGGDEEEEVDGDDGAEDEDDEGDDDEDEDEGDEGDEDNDNDSGITVRWIDGGYLAEGCGRQVRYEVDCVGDPGEEVCSISLDDGKDDDRDRDDDEGDDDSGDDDGGDDDSGDEE